MNFSLVDAEGSRTSMPVSLPMQAARADVIAYLGTLGQAAATPPPHGDPGRDRALGQGPSQDELLRAASDTKHWLSATRIMRGSACRSHQINAGNAAGCARVCIYRSNSAVPTQTNPLVYNGVMYLLTVDQSDRRHRRRDLPRALDLQLAGQG